MKHLALSAARLIAAAALIMIAPFAMAGHPDVSWSLTIGSPQPVPHVYAPPVVYVQPQPIYVRPQPVYVQPATVVYTQPYYVEEVRYKKVKRHHGKHRNHRDYDD